MDQDTLIAIREFLPSPKESPIFLYFFMGLVLGVILVITKDKKYKKIRELFMKLF